MEEPPAEKLASTQGEQLTELDDMPGEFVENVRAHFAIFRAITGKSRSGLQVVDYHVQHGTATLLPHIQIGAPLWKLSAPKDWTLRLCMLFVEDNIVIFSKTNP